MSEEDMAEMVTGCQPPSPSSPKRPLEEVEGEKEEQASPKRPCLEEETEMVQRLYILKGKHFFLHRAPKEESTRVRTVIGNIWWPDHYRPSEFAMLRLLSFFYWLTWPYPEDLQFVEWRKQMGEIHPDSRWREIQHGIIGDSKMESIDFFSV